MALATVDQQKRNIADAETLASSLRARYEAGLAAQAEVIGSDLQIRQQHAPTWPPRKMRRRYPCENLRNF